MATNVNGSMSDIKATTSYEEKGYAAESHEIPLPAILASKTEDELKAIKRSATWKLDLYIMPAMICELFLPSSRRQAVGEPKPRSEMFSATRRFADTCDDSDTTVMYIFNYLDRQNIA